MAKFNLNLKHRAKQYKNMVSIAAIVVIVVISLFTLFSGPSEPPENKNKKSERVFSGIVDDTFADADASSAMTAQQMEITDLKKELSSLKELLNKTKKEEKHSMLTEQQKMEDALLEKLKQEMNKASIKTDGTTAALLASNGDLNPLDFNGGASVSAPLHQLNKTPRIHTVSFDYPRPKPREFSKNEKNYVPSGTFAKAVVLGGADADASVNGAKKNNGVMLFKLISEGTLPNNARSRLKGCFVTASTYGDISSERAYVRLKKISCVQKGRPILDRPVVGWAFFAGKVGIKGKVTMRDDKVAKWAFIGKGIESAGKIVGNMQSVTTYSPYGATSFLPSDRALAAGGASALAGTGEELSRYYIKRAEQYHPVIQVGAGNLVNIVFEDGFSLTSSEDEQKERLHEGVDKSSYSTKDAGIPASILEEINKSGLDYSAAQQPSTQG